MLRATEVELFDGLRAEGLAGRGRLDPTPDPALYDKQHAHCDVLVVGAGPAGLAAADVAASTGPGSCSWKAAPSSAEACSTARRRSTVRQRSTGSRRSPRGSTPPGGAGPRSRHGGRRLRRGLRPDRGAPHGPPRRRTPAGVARERLWHVRPSASCSPRARTSAPVVFAGNDRPASCSRARPARTSSATASRPARARWCSRRRQRLRRGRRAGRRGRGGGGGGGPATRRRSMARAGGRGAP
jgi:sarcosine oxidase subunit alpha